MSFEKANDLSKTALESGSAFAPRFDEKGLIMAIATDHRDRSVLMVAYMNEDALRLTLETSTVHYFSRSRQSLWKKGETSGEMQKLVELRTDCDQDVLLLSVEQTGRGAACHTGRKSCFYRAVENSHGAWTLKMDEAAPLFDPQSVYS